MMVCCGGVVCRTGVDVVAVSHALHEEEALPLAVALQHVVDHLLRRLVPVHPSQHHKTA